jgi:hypothetical protein
VQRSFLQQMLRLGSQTVKVDRFKASSEQADASPAVG